MLIRDFGFKMTRDIIIFVDRINVIVMFVRK